MLFSILCKVFLTDSAIDVLIYSWLALVNAHFYRSRIFQLMISIFEWRLIKLISIYLSLYFITFFHSRESLKYLLASEGLRGLAKGFSLNIIKGPITLSLSLTTYDLLINRCKKYQNRWHIYSYCFIVAQNPYWNLPTS